MAKHTPLPWQSHQSHIYGSNRELIAQFCGTDPVSDRDFVLLACNAHADLLEALKGINRILDTGRSRTFDEMMRDLDFVRDRARAAIRKAEGGE